MTNDEMMNKQISELADLMKGMFTKEELNAIAIIVSNAPIQGKDAKFIDVNNIIDLATTINGLFINR